MYDLQSLCICSQQIAVRPITAINQPIRAKEIEDSIEPVAVELRVQRYPARHAPEHRGHLCEDKWTLGEFPEMSGGGVQLREVIEDHAQAGNTIGQACHVRY